MSLREGSTGASGYTQMPLWVFGCAMVALWISTIISAATLPDPLEAGWQGESVCEQLHETREIRILRCTFPPGVGHERHFHPKHFGYALSGGTMRITDATGTREASLQTGSYFSSEGIAWHEVLNIGDTVVSYLMIEPK